MTWLRRIFGTSVAVASAVAPNCASAEVAQEVFESVEASGFISLAAPEERVGLQAALMQRGVAAIFEVQSLLAPADAEDIAEGGVATFLEDIEPMLARFGARLGTVSETYEEDRHVVNVSGQEWTIWSNDRDGSPDTVEMSKFWAVSTARTFALVNDRLAASGTQIRAYAVGGGNDGLVFFLTPTVAASLARIKELGREAPYLMTETPPYYGAPQ